MKISFWSPLHGQTGTTSNLLITSLISGIKYKKQGLITQTQFNLNNLEAPLIGGNTKDLNTQGYFRDVGIDALIRGFKAARLDKETVENCCVTLKNTNIILLPGTTKTNQEAFDTDMDLVAKALFKAIENVIDIVFVDVGAGGNPISLKILNDSDLVVVNLNQNVELIDYYFTRYKNMINTKIFYLFGNYDDNSKYNIFNLRRMYKDIKNSNSAVIPYSTKYRDVIADTKVIDFVRENIRCTEIEENYYFISKAIEATEKILKQSGIHLKERIKI